MITLDWFQSYPTNRKQRTSVNNTLSNETVMSHGAPQESALGPLGNFQISQIKSKLRQITRSSMNCLFCNF